jgi:PAS domain S-box-containing protein
MFHSVTGLLLRNDPLDAVWRESEKSLDFFRNAGFRDVVDAMVSQQRFIATMQSRTATFSTFSDAQFDEAAFETQLTADRTTMMVCFYWIVKLKTRFLSGDHAEALAAADKAKALLWSSAVHIQLLDYFYYTALTVTALYENATADEQNRWRELLTAHREQLHEWAENYPPTFADKHALVSAEIARLEGRAFDAMQLYEQAIQSARENGFVQNEGLAHELAAQYYLTRGLETVGYAYLRSARNCYYRWGALGKVKQLDERYPRLHEERLPTSTTSTIGTAVRQLDVETVVKASQALSSEILLSKLIEKLMLIAVEHAGAERGLLILLRGDEPQIEAEATTGDGRAKVSVRQAAVTPSDLPQSALHYVIRTRESVVLDDASVRNLYSEDEYVRAKRARSVLCLPIVKQTTLIGALYLENNLTPRAFTSDRVALLEMLASQAAISLENASLYSDLQRSETYLAEAQRLSRTGSFGWNVSSREIFWSDETYSIFEHDRALKPTLELILQRIHPDDRDRVQQTIARASEARANLDFEHRLLMPDASVKHLHVIGRAPNTSSGNVEYVGAVTDITAAKQAEEKIRQSQMELRQILDCAPQIVGVARPDRTRLYANQATLDYYGITLEEWRSCHPHRLCHPEDYDRMTSETQSKFLSGTPYETEGRLPRKDGKYRWFLLRYNPVRDEQGRVVRWYVAGTDIEDRKQAEEKIRQSEMELRQILDFAPQYVAVLGPDRDRTRLYANQTMLEYFGFTLEEWRSSDRQKYYHPDDWERLTSETQSKFLSGIPHEYEARFLRKDGKYRWFLFRWNPLRDEQGRVTRWYAAATDIEERKQAEQRLQNENIALREEIDRASMFEEIVGTSPPLQTVLSRISKVAPTESNVLITGETGTGKELVARAIHRRSRRAGRAFVSVNCAAIPRDLIASELFGHEKGAFTGATQRRLGRFELAEGGTIFLDEVGELPADTQIALLRVLQEHEVERLGGVGSVRTNVRVIAATNRDVEAAIVAGTFRSDLFYRLNVFPIDMPPLRERREDIPLLVEYFIDRYARKAGKSFQTVNKKSLDLLRSYSWPGNIRELQNVIERSVVVCESANFSVDESWLSRQPLASEPNSLELSAKVAAREKEIIEAALSKSGGRVFGPSGAAAKLGIPRSTLESKIRSLKINKSRFKTKSR